MPSPYLGQEFTFYNPDGSTVPVRGWGNQFAAVFETLGGYTVVKNPESGFMDYAVLSPDKQSLVPTGTRAGSTVPQELALPQHLRPTRAATRAQAEAAHDAGPRRRWEERRAERKAAARTAGGPEARAAASDVTGDYTGLVLLVQFPDVPATIPRQEVVDFCNKPGYTGYGNNGSAYDYFRDVSGGRFQYTNLVTEYYTAQHDRSHYTDPSISYGTRTRELITEALDDLKAKSFDFSLLSSDASGYIYALSVFYAGNRVNNWSEGLWPHAWALANPYPVAGGKKFSDYQITDLGDQLTLRTFCHENGHMVCDFPDLYDYGGEGGGVGHYCLMCYGGSDLNPTQISGYLKNEAGWTHRARTLAPATSYDVATGRNDFLIHAKNQTEYFLLENRRQAGRDSSLPDDGLVIWHVDELGSNDHEQMTPAQHYELSLEQADNRFDLERRVNAGDAEDLYSAPSHVAFGDGTAPSSKWWDGTASGLEIESVSEPGDVMTVRTKGAGDMTSIVGTWNIVAVDWGCTGSVGNAGPFTFHADGTWTYQFGGGRWLQVGDMATWNFTNAAGLIYAANTNANSMTGVMGYATVHGGTGCFYLLRSSSPAPSGGAGDTATVDAAQAGGPPADNTDPALGPVGDGTAPTVPDTGVG